MCRDSAVAGIVSAQDWRAHSKKSFRKDQDCPRKPFEKAARKSGLFERCKQGNGRSLPERKGCIQCLQNLVCEICQNGPEGLQFSAHDQLGGIDLRQLLFYIMELLKVSHDMQEPLFVLLAQLIDTVSRYPGKDRALDRNSPSSASDVFGSSPGRSPKNSRILSQFLTQPYADYLVACLRKHLTSPSRSITAVGDGKATGLAKQVLKNKGLTAGKHPHNYVNNSTSKPEEVIEEFSLTRELAFSASILLGHLARFYPELCKNHSMVVLQVLHRDNLDLHRLTRYNPNLRKAIKYAETHWSRFTSADASDCPFDRSQHLVSQLSQMRLDNMFSKKAIVNGIADGLFDDFRRDRRMNVSVLNVSVLNVSVLNVSVEDLPSIHARAWK